MPEEKLEQETDGNPETTYEDVTAHERHGFQTDASTEIGNEEETESFSID